jgi:F-type H+-transporting ATPase subunit delta
LSFVVNPSLLGGLRVQVGSHIYDGSVAGRLAALNESF